MIQGLTHISDRRQSQPQTEEAFAIRARRRAWLKDILYDVRQLLSCAAPCAPRQRLDPEIVELFPGSKVQSASAAVSRDPPKSRTAWRDCYISETPAGKSASHEQFS
jgi:hypothetical protein